MDTIIQPSIETNRLASPDLTRRQIRGSSLLLAGRFVSVGINFAAQVLVVRYLSTQNYGAWAYALAVVALGQSFATFGLDRATTRFVPIYHERKEYGKVLGTIALVIVSILLAGLILIGTFFAFPEALGRFVKNEQQAIVLLSVMIFLVPVEALDKLLIGIFASFSGARAIFFRRHVLGPSLKLGVVGLLILWGSEVAFLAYGYLAASLVGVLIYGWVLIRMLQRQGLFQNFRFDAVRIPAREIFSFTVPLMTSDLLAVVMTSLAVLLLGYFADMEQVAFFRVVLPVAVLNRMVLSSFALLYTPAAARLFAKSDHQSINDLYWRTAAWLAVLSFPIFAVTFSLAQPLTLFLYGARYEQSGVILAILSFGYYFDVLLGFNGLTLKVLGKLRYMVTINLLTAVITVMANLLLVPRWGAFGAALGTAGAMIPVCTSQAVGFTSHLRP